MTPSSGELVVLGVAEAASWALCEQQLRASLGQAASVAAIRATVEASLYWPRFTAAVHRGDITERHRDLPRPGPLAELLVLWARRAAKDDQ